jgi:hypothetical protein
MLVLKKLILFNEMLCLCVCCEEKVRAKTRFGHEYVNVPTPEPPGCLAQP